MESEYAYFNELYLFNKIEAWNKPQQKSLARWTVGVFEHSWQPLAQRIAAAEDPVDVLGDPPYTFIFRTELHELMYRHRLPDADGFSIMAKRCLDGAVNAGVLPDDDSGHIERVVLTVPTLTVWDQHQTSVIATARVRHRGVLEATC